MSTEKGHPTLDKIESIKSKYLDGFDDRDKSVVQAWEQSVKELMVREKLSENKALIQVLRKYINDVREINYLLVTADSAKLSDKERDRLLDKKRLYTDFLMLFDSTQIQKELEAVEKSIQELAPLDEKMA